MLTRAAAALVAAAESRTQALAAGQRRDRFLAAAGWVMRPEDAAAVLGVAPQRIRSARRLFRGERDALDAVPEIEADRGDQDNGEAPATPLFYQSPDPAAWS